MTRIWQSIWPGNTQRSFKDRVGDRIALAVIGVILIWHLVSLIRLGPIEYVLMCLEAFSALSQG